MMMACEHPTMMQINGTCTMLNSPSSVTDFKSDFGDFDNSVRCLELLNSVSSTNNSSSVDSLRGLWSIIGQHAAHENEGGSNDGNAVSRPFTDAATSKESKRSQRTTHRRKKSSSKGANGQESTRGVVQEEDDSKELSDTISSNMMTGISNRTTSRIERVGDDVVKPRSRKSREKKKGNNHHKEDVASGRHVSFTKSNDTSEFNTIESQRMEWKTNKNFFMSTSARNIQLQSSPRPGHRRRSLHFSVISDHTDPATTNNINDNVNIPNNGHVSDPKLCQKMNIMMMMDPKSSTSSSSSADVMMPYPSSMRRVNNVPTIDSPPKQPQRMMTPIVKREKVCRRSMKAAAPLITSDP